jgi:hypothetical protein
MRGDALSAGTLQELRAHAGVGMSMESCSWTKQRVSNGAVEGMNNKIKSISHRSFGFRTADTLASM